jgi:hypothetical protein
MESGKMSNDEKPRRAFGSNGEEIPPPIDWSKSYYQKLGQFPDSDMIAWVKNWGVTDENAVGMAHTDSQRLENLKAMTALVDELLHDISGVADHIDSTEYSRKQAGKYAADFIKYICAEFKA